MTLHGFFPNIAWLDPMTLLDVQSI